MDDFLHTFISSLLETRRHKSGAVAPEGQEQFGAGGGDGVRPTHPSPWVHRGNGKSAIF